MNISKHYPGRGDRQQRHRVVNELLCEFDDVVVGDKRVSQPDERMRQLLVAIHRASPLLLKSSHEER